VAISNLRFLIISSNFTSAKAQSLLGWKPKLRLSTALEWIVEWYRGYQQNEDMRALTEEQKIDLSRKVTERFGIDQKIAVIPNGVSLEAFYPIDISLEV